MIQGKPKIELMFAWYDIWVGVFIDKRKRIVYVFPLPMIGIKITLAKRGEQCDAKEMLIQGI